jgi:hypothetical protein
MSCDVNSLLGQAKKIETDLRKIRAGEELCAIAGSIDPSFSLVIRYQKEHLIHSKAPSLYAC